MPWPAVRILLMHSIEDVTARSFPWVTGCLECDIYASVGFYRVTITIKVKLPLPVRFLGIPDVEFECCPSFRGATPQAPDFEPRTRLLRWALGLGVLYAHDCTCIYTYIHLCTYIHIYIHTHIKHIYIHMYIYISTYISQAARPASRRRGCMWRSGFISTRRCLEDPLLSLLRSTQLNHHLNENRVLRYIVRLGK